MIIDAYNVFSDDQAITGDAASTNVLDMGAAGIAPGNPLSVITQITANFNTLTSLDLQVQSCAVEGFGSGVVTHQSVNILLAALVAGKRVDLGSLLDGTLRYVRLNYNVNGSNPSTGKITAVLMPFGDQTLVGQG